MLDFEKDELWWVLLFGNASSTCALTLRIWSVTDATLNEGIEHQKFQKRQSSKILNSWPENAIIFLLFAIRYLIISPLNHGNEDSFQVFFALLIPPILEVNSYQIYQILFMDPWDPNWKLSPQNMLPKNPGLSVASAVAMAFPRDERPKLHSWKFEDHGECCLNFFQNVWYQGVKCIISKLKLEDFKRWNFMIGSLFKWVTFWAVKLQLPTVYHSVHLLKDEKPRWSFRFPLEIGFGIQDCWLFPSCFTQNSSRKKSAGNGVFDEMMGFFEVRFSHIFTASPEIRESRQCLEYWCSERCCCFQHGYGMVLPVQQTVLGFSRHTVSFFGQGSYHLDFNMCRNTVFTTIHAMMRICICM